MDVNGLSTKRCTQTATGGNEERSGGQAVPGAQATARATLSRIERRVRLCGLAPTHHLRQRAWPVRSLTGRGTRQRSFVTTDGVENAPKSCTFTKRVRCVSKLVEWLRMWLTLANDSGSPS
eukprot:2064718-Prymnesium_polylepis.1